MRHHDGQDKRKRANGKTDHAQATILADMPPAKEASSATENATENGGAKEPRPVRLRTAHDASITVKALELRVDRLKKLEKTMAGDGYRREARAVRADADSILEHVLPAFREQ